MLRYLHTRLAILFFVTFLAHLAAALHHGLIPRDAVLSSMTTRRMSVLRVFASEESTVPVAQGSLGSVPDRSATPPGG